MPIKIKREDGSCTEYRNARLIPAFLMIPKELLIRCGMEMFMLPRTRAGLFADPGTIRKVESNLFRECVIDAYAYMAWPHMGLKGRLEDYSGYNPCWKVTHAPSLWIDELTDCGVLPSLDQWLQETEPYPYRYHMFMPYALVDAYLSIVVPRVMLRDGYWEWLTMCRSTRALRTLTSIGTAGRKRILSRNGIIRGRSTRRRSHARCCAFMRSLTVRKLGCSIPTSTRSSRTISPQRLT